MDEPKPDELTQPNSLESETQLRPRATPPQLGRHQQPGPHQQLGHQQPGPPQPVPQQQPRLQQPSGPHRQSGPQSGPPPAQHLDPRQRTAQGPRPSNPVNNRPILLTPGLPAGYGMVDVDPSSAGLVRKELPGWAWFFVALGLAAMIFAYFQPWFLLEFRNGDVETVVHSRLLNFHADYISVFGTASHEVDVPVRSHRFIPWGLALSTFVVVGVAVLAAIGLRRAILTTLIRVLGVVLCLGAAVVSVWCSWIDPRSLDDIPAGRFGSVEPTIGAIVWFCALLPMLIASALGPRISYRLPGADSSTPGAMTSSQQSAGGLIRKQTQVVSIVVSLVGFIAVVVGMFVIPWDASGNVYFSDIGEAVIDGAEMEFEFQDIYFTWLGWVVLGWCLLSAIMMMVGRTGFTALRPVWAICALACVVAHLVACVPLSDTSIAPFVAAAGIMMVALATLLPLKVTARVAVPVR